MSSTNQDSYEPVQSHNSEKHQLVVFSNASSKSTLSGPVISSVSSCAIACYPESSNLSVSSPLLENDVDSGSSDKAEQNFPNKHSEILRMNQIKSEPPDSDNENTVNQSEQIIIPNTDVISNPYGSDVPSVSSYLGTKYSDIFNSDNNKALFKTEKNEDHSASIDDKALKTKTKNHQQLVTSVGKRTENKKKRTPKPNNNRYTDMFVPFKKLQPSENYRLMQDFFIPALEENTFGDLLRWDGKEDRIFAVKWTHKAKTSWSVEEGEVFIAWDLLKGRTPPTTHQELVNSKQRIRAALANIRNIKEETPIPGYRRYRIVGDLGPSCVQYPSKNLKKIAPKSPLISPSKPSELDKEPAKEKLTSEVNNELPRILHSSRAAAFAAADRIKCLVPVVFNNNSDKKKGKKTGTKPIDPQSDSSESSESHSNSQESKQPSKTTIREVSTPYGPDNPSVSAYPPSNYSDRLNCENYAVSSPQPKVKDKTVSVVHKKKPKRLNVKKTRFTWKKKYKTKKQKVDTKTNAKVTSSATRQTLKNTDKTANHLSQDLEDYSTVPMSIPESPSETQGPLSNLESFNIKVSEISTPDNSWTVNNLFESILCVKWSKSFIQEARIIIEKNLDTRVYAREQELQLGFSISCLEDISNLMNLVQRYLKFLTTDEMHT